MRVPFLPLLLLISLGVDGQEFVRPFGSHSSGPDGVVGLTGSTLNYPGSINAGFLLGEMYNFLQTKDASLSVGTLLKGGMENRYGLGIPGSIAWIILSGWSGGNPDLGPNFTGYGEFPLLVHYNFGLDATQETQKRFGFYLGGGMTYVFTGYLGATGNAENTSFYAWEADAGIRFKNAEIGFTGVFSLRQPVGPIQNPCMFGLTISTFMEK